MSTYIVSPGGASGAATSPPILTLTNGGGSDSELVIPMLQDVTISNANDVFTWTQLNESAKLQVATTSTNSISTNIVVDSDIFFGSGADTGSAEKKGLIGLSVDKDEVSFEINIGDKTLSGVGYVTGLAPTVSADSPVWVTPVTITVSGEFTVA